MPVVTYTTFDGVETDQDARIGDSVMETATKNGVPGIVAECGGSLSCATCHVYVDENFFALIGEPEDLEDEMLDGTACDRQPNSRLSCQIRMTDELDGLRVTTPKAQV